MDRNLAEPDQEEIANKSHPARGAWIEILQSRTKWQILASHPARGAWIEILIRFVMSAQFWSHPARGAWIEIKRYSYKYW